MTQIILYDPLCKHTTFVILWVRGVTYKMISELRFKIIKNSNKIMPEITISLQEIKVLVTVFLPLLIVFISNSITDCNI